MFRGQRMVWLGEIGSFDVIPHFSSPDDLPRVLGQRLLQHLQRTFEGHPSLLGEADTTDRKILSKSQTFMSKSFTFNNRRTYGPNLVCLTDTLGKSRFVHNKYGVTNGNASKT